MTAQNYRPKVSTGSLAGRRTLSTNSTATTRSRKSARKSDARGQGARVLWILMIVGGLIGSGFVMAQHSQINVHQFRQAEEKVKTQLDELTNQQRFLALEKERVVNTQESDRIAKNAGLVQPKLDGAMAAPIRAEARTEPKPEALKVAAKPAAKPAVKAESKPSGKPVGKQTPLKQPAKQLAKPTVKPAAKPVAKPVAAKTVSRSAPPNKANGKQQLAQAVVQPKAQTKKDKHR